MKRDMDFVRDLLLKIEASDGRLGMNDLGDRKNKEEWSNLAYHMQMLVKEAGYISAVDGSTFNGPYFLNLTLTWQGHEFLNAILDPEVWRRTKEGATTVGNFAVGFLFDAAKAYAKHVAKERLGLDL